MKPCTTVKKQILCTSLSPCGRQDLLVTPPNVMIQPFCCTSGLHQRTSIMLGVFERYDTVEAVSESGLFCITSNCMPLPLPFLLFLPLFVLLLLLLLGLSYALPPPGCQQFFTMSRSTSSCACWCVCVAGVACASSFLVLVFAFAIPLAFLEKSTCILLSSSALVSF